MATRRTRPDPQLMIKGFQNPIQLFKNMDITLVIVTMLLVIMGLSCIYSAGGGTQGIGFSLALRQAFVMGISICAMCIVLYVGYRRFYDWAYYLYFFSLFLLVLVLIIGLATKGAQSWLNLGPFRFQPSEFGKIAFALVLSKHLCRHSPSDPFGFWGTVILASPSILLILLEPDLGSAAVYCFMLLIALVIAGGINRNLLILTGLGVAILPIGWHFLKEYQKLRLIVFLNPSLDPLGAGYNVIQSRIAVGSGGLLGKGYLQGMQSKLHFLPEPHTDFIFSVLAEEWGFVGGSLLIFLFSLLLWKIIRVGIKTKDIRAKIFVSAISAWIWFQFAEGLAMSMGLSPVTGLPFPFISYGGSSLMSLGIGMAFIISIQLSTVKQFR